MPENAAGSVEVEIRARLDVLEQSLEQARARLQNFDKAAARPAQAIRGLEAASGGAASALRNLSSNVAVLQGPLGPIAGRVSFLATTIERVGVVGAIAAIGLTAVAATTVKALRAFSEAERIGLITEAVLRATGYAAGQSAAQIDDMATRLGHLTIVSDEVAKSAANIILTFKAIQGEAFEQTLVLAQDLAAVGFGSITSSALQLAKALEEPEIGLTMLRRSGVSFSAAQKELIKDMIATGQHGRAMNYILEQVRVQVGGAGAAQAGGLAGAWHKLSEATGNWLERAGGQIAAASGLRDIVVKVADALKEANDQATRIEQTPAQTALVETTKRIAEVEREMQRIRELETSMQGPKAWMYSDTWALRPAAHAQALQKLKSELAGLQSSRLELQAAADWEALNKQVEDYANRGKAAAATIARQKEAFEGVQITLTKEIELLRKGALARAIYEQQVKGKVAPPAAGQPDERTAQQKAYADEIAALTKREFYIKMGLQLMSQRISLLGPMATADEQVAVKTREINEAMRDGLSLRGSEIALILERARVQADEQRLSERAAYGLVTAQDAARQKLAEFNLVSKQYNLPSTAQVGAMNALEKKYRDIADASAIAASRLPNFTRASLDALNFDKALDMLATSGVDNLASALNDVAMGNKTLGESFRSLSLTVLGEFNKMIIKALLFKMIQQSMGLGGGGGGILSLLGLGGGAGGSGSGAGPVPTGIGHSGAVIGQTGSRRLVHPAYYENAPRMHSGGKINWGAGERPFVGKVGEEVGWPDQLAAKYGGGGGDNRGSSAPTTAPSIEFNVNVQNNNNSDVQVEKRPNSSGGFDVEVMIKNVVKDGHANGEFSAALNARNRAPQRIIRR